MRLMHWLKCDDTQEVVEGNRCCLDNGITFYLNHYDNTALMNDNQATRVQQLEACKLMVSFGYRVEG